MEHADQLGGVGGGGGDAAVALLDGNPGAGGTGARGNRRVQRSRAEKGGSTNLRTPGYAGQGPGPSANADFRADGDPAVWAEPGRQRDAKAEAPAALGTGGRGADRPGRRRALQTSGRRRDGEAAGAEGDAGTAIGSVGVPAIFRLDRGGQRREQGVDPY